MKNQIIISLCIIMLMSFSFIANAQRTNFSTSSTIGITTPILDNGIGIHIGINPSYSLSSNFSIEGQVSYMYTKITSSFLSGTEGSDNSINALAGGRLYFKAAEKATRFYLNLLVGGNYSREIKNGRNEGEFGAGFSGGAFLEINKFLLGLSYETPQNFIVKIGYVF